MPKILSTAELEKIQPNPSGDVRSLCLTFTLEKLVAIPFGRGHYTFEDEKQNLQELGWSVASRSYYLIDPNVPDSCYLQFTVYRVVAWFPAIEDPYEIMRAHARVFSTSFLKVMPRYDLV